MVDNSEAGIAEEELASEDGPADSVGALSVIWDC